MVFAFVYSFSFASPKTREAKEGNDLVGFNLSSWQGSGHLGCFEVSGYQKMLLFFFFFLNVYFWDTWVAQLV